MEKKTKVTASPGGYEIVIERTFATTPEKLWRAYTEPEIFAKWQGPDNLETIIKDWEMKPGGKWSYVAKGPDGSEYGFHGVTHELVPAERSVQTFEYEGTPGHVAMNTAYFTREGDATKVRVVSVFQSPDDRDGMIAAGMEGGMNEGYARLDEIVKSL